MPGAYAHLLIADKALEGFRDEQGIDEKLCGLALTHSHFVYLGSLGPDYPRLDFLQPGQKDWGDHMHYGHTGDIIGAMTRRLSTLWNRGFLEEDFIIPFCWTLGYISHVTADLIIHPVILNIVGPYTGNEEEHRHCEMIQDAFIYNKFRLGAEIEHSQLMSIMEISSNPRRHEEVHPILRSFWSDMLNESFLDDFSKNPPDIDQWHHHFKSWVGMAGRPLFVGRIIDPNHKFAYKQTAEITPAERHFFLDRLHLPNGEIGSYEEDVFPKAVEHVRDQWVFLSEAISKRDMDLFLASLNNCDLDTGRSLKTSKLIYWQG